MNILLHLQITLANFCIITRLMKITLLSNSHISYVTGTFLLIKKIILHEIWSVIDNYFFKILNKYNYKLLLI